jgi:hypothetical protein
VATSVKPQNKIGRRKHDLLVELGYSPDGVSGGGHYRYTHPDAEDYFVSGTAYDGAAWQMFVSDMRRRHPSAFEQQRSERRLTKKQRADRAARRAARTPLRLTVETADDPVAVVETVRVPNPGSPEAVDEGCTCPVFKNNRGRGLDESDGSDWLDGGVFEVLIGCPLHDDEPEVLCEDSDERRCECGNPLPSRRGPGRPRKWCLSCRPSTWDGATEEQRERRREHYRRWYRKRFRDDQEAAA